MLYQEFWQRLKTDPISSLYMFQGEEDYLMERAVDALETTMAPCDKKIFYGDETEINEILRELVEMSLFASVRKLLVVKDAHALKNMEKLTAKIMGSSHTLVLLNPSTKTIKESSRATMVEFPLLKGEMLKKWVTKRLLNEGIMLESKIIDTLFMHLPQKMYAIENELTKLLLFKGDRELNSELIKNILSLEVETNTFVLVRDTLTKKKKEAQEKLAILFNEGEEIFFIISLLYRELIHLLLFKIASKENTSRLKVPPWKHKYYSSLADTLTIRTILSKLREILTLEIQLKSVVINERFSLRYLIGELSR